MKLQISDSDKKISLVKINISIGIQVYGCLREIGVTGYTMNWRSYSIDIQSY